MSALPEEQLTLGNCWLLSFMTTISLGLNFVFEQLPDHTAVRRDQMKFQTMLRQQFFKLGTLEFNPWGRNPHRRASLFLLSAFLSLTPALLSLILTFQVSGCPCLLFPQSRAARSHPSPVSSMWIFKHSTRHLKTVITLPFSKWPYKSACSGASLRIS